MAKKFPVKKSKTAAPSGRPENQFQQFGYNDTTLSSAEAEALRIVKFEKTNWETAFAYVTEKVAFNMRNVIRQCRKNYWGVYDTPTDPTTGREKLWEHLTKTFVDYVVAAYDLDTKDIQFHAKHKDAIGLASVVRSIVKNKLEQARFGEELDKALRQLAIDGTIVWRTETVDNKVKINLVDLLNFYIDPTVDSIAEAESIIERVVVTKDEFTRMANAGNWLNAKKVVGSKQVSRYDTINNPGYNSNSDVPFVELYKRRGLARKFVLTGNPNDKELVPTEIICSGTNGNWFFHFAKSRPDNKDKGYEEAWMIRVHGRWYGEGVAERLIQKQIHFNAISNIRMNREYLQQLGIMLVRKGAGITPQMISRLAANGAIAVSNVETDIKPLTVPPIDASSYKSEELIYDWAQRYTGASDITVGEPSPASKPATTAALENQNSQTRFTLIKDGIGMFLQRWLRNQALPAMFSTVKEGDLVRMHLDNDQLRQFDERLVNDELAKQLDAANKAGKFVDENQVLMEMQRGMAKLQSNGRNRFVKLLHTVDLTEYDLSIDITNEEMAVPVMVQNLLQILQTLPAVQGINPQSIMDIVRQVMDLMGLDSKLLELQQQGTQPGMQQMMQGGMNPQSQANGQANMTQPGGNPKQQVPQQGLASIMGPAMTMEPR